MGPRIESLNAGTPPLVGVEGTVLPDSRLKSLLMGTKMPAPGVFVVKYCILSTRAVQSVLGVSSRGDGAYAKCVDVWCYSPVNMTTVLAARREFWSKLDAGKSALAPVDGADEADCAGHVARDVDDVSLTKVVHSGDGPARGEGRHPVVVRAGLSQDVLEFVNFGRVWDGRETGA